MSSIARQTSSVGELKVEIFVQQSVFSFSLLSAHSVNI